MDAFEVTNKVSDLTRSARECVAYLGENGVGYHYMFMLETLEYLNSSGKLNMPPKRKVSVKDLTKKHNFDKRTKAEKRKAFELIQK